MSLIKNETADTDTVDPRWKDLYKIGWIIPIISILITILAVTAFFIWPYAPGSISTKEIFSTIQTNKLGALMSLDLLLLIGIFITLPLFLALYISLRHINQSYASIALLLGLVAVILIIPARPIMELFALSDLYSTAVDDVAKNRYLASGETLLVIFDGTAWAASTVLNAVSYLIFSFLMLNSDFFSKTTAYSGIVANIFALGFFIPKIGPILLLIATIGGVVYLSFLCRDFFRLERKAMLIK